MKATWENVVLAESEQTVVIEGNHYQNQIGIDTDSLAGC
jgi:uncharacterized protein (DUF427 family)